MTFIDTMQSNLLNLLFAIVIVWTVMPYDAYSQNHTISGYIKDGQTGETLIGANLSSTLSAIGTTSNTYGFYSLTLPEGNHVLEVSYLGYATDTLQIDLYRDTSVTFELSAGIAIQEIVISAEEDKAKANVESTQMGTIELPTKLVKQIPAIFGEVDILKTIQLLPGIQSAGEGASGFFVRGGGPDQNLILLDEAVVYNTGHLLGFFSVFNADAIKSSKLIKGNLPASYGGRLSSVLDIQMKEGNDRHFEAEGGIGMVSSRLTVQGPLAKEKASFLLSGRRTYALDLAQPLINGTDFAGTNYYFYDLNGKVNYRINDKNRLYLSGYFGRDILTFRQPARDFAFDLPYGNKTATLRYNHLFNNKLFSNATLVYNSYDFAVSGAQDNFAFELFSGVEDYTAKLDFDYFPMPQHTIKFGSSFTLHELTPNTASATNGEVDFGNELLPKHSRDWAAYIQDEWKLNNSLSLELGMRYNRFTHIGPYTSSIDGVVYDHGDPVVTYDGWEPRLASRIGLSKNQSLKFGFTKAYQYLHLVSNSSTTLPTDLWVPSSELVAPQSSLQYAGGYFHNFLNNALETSIEVYYKSMDNQIDYADNYVTDISEEVEKSFVVGTGEAYGLELFVKKNKGKLTGWIGYTLSRTTRSFPDIEDGRVFPAVYDRTHDLSIVTNYGLSDKISFSAVFIYGTGRAFTPLQGFFVINGGLNTYYGPRNSARLDDYHRIDFSMTYTPKPYSTKKWRGSWTLSLYNVYNRKNPFFISYNPSGSFSQGTFEIDAEKVTIFPLIPSITYNFSWNAK